jgi:hypothetical protein
VNGKKISERNADFPQPCFKAALGQRLGPRLGMALYYRVLLQTADELWAGTDDVIVCWLQGESGRTGEQTLSTPQVNDSGTSGHLALLHHAPALLLHVAGMRLLLRSAVRTGGWGRWSE